MSALQIKRQLEDLQAERAVAEIAGLGDVHGGPTHSGRRRAGRGVA